MTPKSAMAAKPVPMQKQVLIVAGPHEPAAEAFDIYDVYPFPTGFEEDYYSQFAGRTVGIWPSTKKGGREIASRVAEDLANHDNPAAVIAMIDPEGDEYPKDWDLADALAAGWDKKRLKAHSRREAGKFIQRIDRAFLKQKREQLDEQARVMRSELKLLETPVVAPSPPAKKGRTFSADYAEIQGGKDDQALWSSLNLDKGTNQLPHPNEANAIRILESHAEFAGKIWLDEFSQKLMYADRAFSKADAVDLLVRIQTALRMPKMGLQAVERAALWVGSSDKRHLLKDWLLKLRWDGIERLPTLMADAWGAEQNDYSSAVGRCFMVAMAARVFKPGLKMDNMVVLEGAQGIRKSSSFRELGGEWYLEHHEDPVKNRKDFLGGLQGKLLIEIPEMHAIAGRAAGVDIVKGIISCQVDNYRVPYGTGNMDYPRQCVFVGTTNREQWNPDPTGGRRFWPIRCGAINLDYIRSEREQLFAEAVTRFQRGEPWYDVPQAAAEEEQEQRREHDEWETVFHRYINEYPDRSSPQTYWHPRPEPLASVTITQLLSEALAIPEGRWGKSEQMRAASAIKALGYRRTKVGSDRHWAYVHYPAMKF